MKKIISDRHIVVVLFIVVFITFSFAQQDSKQLEEFHSTGFRPLPVAEKSSSLIIEKKKPENGFVQASVAKEVQN